MIIKTKVESLDYFGRGISHLNNKIVFIENALPSEEVEVEILKEEKKFLEGKVINYIKTSNKRVNPECPYYNNCGGCNISHLTEEDQLKFKADNLVSVLSKYADININPIVIESPKKKYYRNKVNLKIQKFKWGYYESKTHNFTPINKCLIAKEAINKIIDNQELFKISEGEITIRSNYNDEILININTDSKVDIDIESLRKDSKLLGIVLNDKILYGKDSFIELVNNYLFQVSMKSFFQVNLDILSKIFNVISEKPYNNIVDLYCGVGALGIVINKKKLYGIETSASSVKDALISAKMNKQLNNLYLLGDSSKISEIKAEIDMLIVDPPRNGINKKTMNHILESKIDKMIYMSCNPNTLAKDLKVLKEKYKIEKSYLFNMFPQTFHIETIVFLNLKNK